MKKTLILTTLLATAAVGAFGQGQVVFNNRLTTGGGPGTFNQPLYAPIYGVNSANPGQVLTGQGATGPGGNPIPVGGTDYAGRTPLAGTGFTAQLWWGAPGTPEAQLQAVSAANGGVSTFRTGATTVGAFNGTTATLGTPGGTGTRATLQVRAWDNMGGTITDWAAIMANPAIPHGSSPVFMPDFDLGGGTAQPPNLVGLQSFGLFQVPEPSVIALGALGLGFLVLRRIRK